MKLHSILLISLGLIIGLSIPVNGSFWIKDDNRGWSEPPKCPPSTHPEFWGVTQVALELTNNTVEWVPIYRCIQGEQQPEQIPLETNSTEPKPTSTIKSDI